MQIQDRERQRRVVSGVMVEMRQCGAIYVKLKAQRVFVMMSLTRLMDQVVLDLKCQAAGQPGHEGKRRQQMQQEQDQSKPTTEHVEILANTKAGAV